MGRNEVDRALGSLRAEVSKRPERLDLRLVHGSMASRAGRREEAAAEFKLLLTKFDQNSKALADINLRLGNLYFRTGDIAQSLPYFEKAKQLQPADSMILHSLGVAYDSLGRKKEAAALYEACLKIDGQNPVVMNNLAYYISQNGGDLDQALTFAQRARQSSPNELAYSDTVAFIYLKKNLVENALEILENLVSKSPKDPVFRAHLGEALLKKGETARGRKELQAALSAKPAPAEAARIKELLGKHGG
jgi:Flp pilus assembly protein TadD